MAIAKRLRKALVALLAVLGILLWLVALLLFTQVTENSADFSRRLFWILLINSIGLSVLIVLVIGNLAHLIRDYRRHVPGSRLRARMVALLVLLAVTPLVGVYAFSVQFINRGIDNWFNLDVERGLDDALELGQTALDVFKRDRLEDAERIAARLAATDRTSIVAALSELRDESAALELTLYGANRQILATSSDVPGRVGAAVSERGGAAPAAPGAAVREHRAATRRPVSDPRHGASAGTRHRAGKLELLQATFPIEQRLSMLANQVQRSHDQYAALSFVRPALKTELHADAEPRARDLATRVRVRRVLLRASIGRADSAAHASDASRRSRRLRYARATESRLATRSASS